MNFHVRSLTACLFLLGGLAAAFQGGGKALPGGGISTAQAGSAQNIPTVITSFDLIKDHVLLSVDVNGKGPQWFVLDTGASGYVMSLEGARRLGLRLDRIREERDRGVGEGTTETSSLKGKISLRIEGKGIADAKLPVVSMDDIEQFLGRPIGGMIGAPLFQKYVVEVDYANHVLKLYDPGTYVYRGKGYVIPVSPQGTPSFRATVVLPSGEALVATLEIDMGSSSALDLNSPFVLAHNLPEPGQSTIPIVGGGIGGRYPQKEGRMKSLLFGSLAIEKPLVIFSEAQSGLTATIREDGFIGNSILERFTVILDYSRKHMILEPNALFGSSFTDNMSGLWRGPITKGPDGDERVEWLKAAPVKGPAKLAGVSEGDKVVAVNGKPCADYPMQVLKSLLWQEGKTLVLTVERGGKKMEITFTTPRLL